MSRSVIRGSATDGLLLVAHGSVCARSALEMQALAGLVGSAGVKQDDDIQIIDGVKAGDKVILSGAYGLPDKTKVKVEAAAASPEKEPAGKEADDK